jgi:hypothetical protein
MPAKVLNTYMNMMFVPIMTIYFHSMGKYFGRIVILFNIKKAVPNETNKIQTSIKNTIQRGRYLRLEILR